MEEITYKILRLLSHGVNLQKLTDFAGIYYPGKLVSLVSVSGRILSCTSPEKIQNEFIRSQAESGFMSEATYELCRSGKLLSRLETAGHAFLTDDVQHDDLSWVMSSVRIQGSVVAYFTIAGTYGSFSDEEIRQTDIFSQAYSIILQQEKKGSTTSLTRGTVLLKELLDGTVIDELTLASRMKMLGLPVYRKICVGIIRKEQPETALSVPVLRAIADKITHAFSESCISAFYDNGIVLLIERKDGDFLNMKADLKDADGILAAEEMRMGISDSFAHLSMLRDYYEQAAAALKIGKTINGDCRIIPYSSVFPYHLLLASGKDMFKFCHPVLYDMYHSSSMLEREEVKTLFLYFRNMKNAGLVSDMLHIHRNTLFHRIAKVAETAGLDLNDSADVFRVLITDRAIELMEKQKITE